MKTPELILNAAIGVLQRSGRCFGDFARDGKVCVLGALAVAAGEPASMWWGLQEAESEHRLKPSDVVLIEAARTLARVVAPARADLDLDSLCTAVGAWHDGASASRPPGDGVVYEVLQQAAHLAEQAEGVQ